MKPTPEQETILEAVRSTTSNLSVRSGPGTGKTTTATMIAREIDGPVLCLAFNRKIANELQQKMPSNCKCKTFNGLGMGALYQFLANEPRLEKDKMKPIARDLCTYKEFPDLIRALGLAKGMGFGPPDKGVNSWDDLDAWEQMFAQNSLDIGEQTIESAAKHCKRGLEISIVQARSSLIDFDDQIYTPALFGATFPRYKCVIIDEAQDNNPIQLRFLDRVTHNRTVRLISIGDPNQAIYGFRGSLSDAMDQIEEAYNCETLPLSLSHRCPPSVVAEAKVWLKGAQLESSLTEEKSCVYGSRERAYKAKLDGIPDGAAILCRNNAPIVRLALTFISKGRSATVLGRDIGKSMATMIRKSGATPGDKLKEIEEMIINERQRTISRLQGKDRKRAELEGFLDRCDALFAVFDFLEPEDDYQKLLATIEDLFSEKPSRLTLSTIHKAKGMEWPAVFFFLSELIPSKFAKTEEELRQEYNLAYVAVTRAQKLLVYIDDGIYYHEEEEK